MKNNSNIVVTGQSNPNFDEHGAGVISTLNAASQPTPPTIAEAMAVITEALRTDSDIQSMKFAEWLSKNYWQYNYQLELWKLPMDRTWNRSTESLLSLFKTEIEGHGTKL